MRFRVSTIRTDRTERRENGLADRLGGGLQRINRTSEIERTRSEAEFSHGQCDRPHRRKSPFMKSTNLQRERKHEKKNKNDGDADNDGRQ